MKRILLMVAYNIFVIPYLGIKLWYYATHVDNYTEQERYALLRKMVFRATKGGRVTIETYGVENIPDQNGFLFFPNHQGLFDVLAIVQACPTPLSVVMKKEVQDIPFLKQVFSCMKAYAIDRKDVRQSLRVIQEVAEEVKGGRNYLIFAEGTRSKNQNHLLELKGGSFKCAIKAKCPIVPIALIDSYKAFDTNSIKKVKVQVHFLEPLLYEQYQYMKSTEIAVEVKHKIEEEIAKFENKEKLIEND